MNTSTNILFLLMPEELVGPLLLFMIVAGGFAIMIGARRVGKTLIISAIAFPFISIIVSALFDDLFTALPEWLVMPVAFLILAILYLSVGWMTIKAIFGQKAVDHAKGDLLAGGVRKSLGFLFSKTGFLLATAVLTVTYFNFAYGT